MTKKSDNVWIVQRATYDDLNKWDTVIVKDDYRGAADYLDHCRANQPEDGVFYAHRLVKKTRQSVSNKYLYLWYIQGNYSYGYGWEDLAGYESIREAISDKKEYQLAEPGVSHRLIRRRELNPEYQGVK